MSTADPRVWLARVKWGGLGWGRAGGGPRGSDSHRLIWWILSWLINCRQQQGFSFPWTFWGDKKKKKEKTKECRTNESKHLRGRTHTRVHTLKVTELEGSDSGADNIWSPVTEIPVCIRQRWNICPLSPTTPVIRGELRWNDAFSDTMDTSRWPTFRKETSSRPRWRWAPHWAIFAFRANRTGRMLPVKSL